MPNFGREEDGAPATSAAGAADAGAAQILAGMKPLRLPVCRSSMQPAVRATHLPPAGLHSCLAGWWARWHHVHRRRHPRAVVLHQQESHLCSCLPAAALQGFIPGWLVEALDHGMLKRMIKAYMALPFSGV